VAWRTAILVASGLLTYVNGLGNPFVFDDASTIVDNEALRHLDFWGVLLPVRELPIAGRPVVSLTFAANYAIGGLDVAGYHIVNIALHVLCALALFGVVRRALALRSIDPALARRSTDVAFAAGLLWVVHPLNSEVVDYLTQRTESAMALCYLITLYASIRSLAAPGRWGPLAVLSCALGMASKESMASAPLVVLLFDRIFAFDSFAHALKQRWKLYGGLAATWLVLAALLATGPRPMSAGFSVGLSPWSYLLNQTAMISRYLRLAVWPDSLVANYGWPRMLTLHDVLPYAVLLLALAALSAAALARYPKVGFIGAWFFVTLAPASSLVPIATEVGAERRMYLPLAGLAVLVVVGALRLLDVVSSRRSHDGASSRRVSLVGAPLLAACALTLAAATVQRNREYGSEVTLARTVLDRYPTPVAHHLLGEVLLEAGRREEGVAHLRQALPGAPRAHLPLGVELVAEGKLDEAIAELQAFVRAQPKLLHVIKAHEYLGRAFARQERWPEAEAEFKEILRLAPNNPAAEHLLAEVYFEQQRFPEAIERFKAYLAAAPPNVEVLNKFGAALGSTNDLDGALAAFRQAIVLDPSNGAVRRNLATALLARRDYDEALEHARRAVELQPDDAGSHDVLGQILRQEGRGREAAAEFTRSRSLRGCRDREAGLRC
jgi:tetratricopeptide (TPR) repeat protein